ncbi:MAG: hypothetical protein Q8891_07490 [Bacteroidota bacterium]|nr:hypothetical protein [Bacteroidota bacterium]
MNIKKTCFFLLLLLAAGCNEGNKNKTKTDTKYAKGSYGYDAAFLKKYSTGIIELQNGNAKVLLSANYQGRVMTSTAAGDSGSSYGWINYSLISSGIKKKQFNPVGGEERLWLGPEGGQFSIYFKKGDSFNIKNWQVPAVIDTEKFDVIRSDSSSATFSKNAILTNYSGSVFHLQIKRKIQLLDKSTTEQILNSNIPSGVQFVAYQSFNQIINSGNNKWKKETGLLSIWLLGMMTPTEQTKVIIPFSPHPNARSFITDNYFGEIPQDRLTVKDSILYFRCDGKSRGKLGIAPVIAKPIVGSFDFEKNILTILIPEVHKNEMYVNSKWEIQKEPYKGDVINSYNDGPLQDGSQLGPFYEIESSSPVKELMPGQSEEYQQTIIHFHGNYLSLKELANRLLNVDLNTVKNW